MIEDREDLTHIPLPTIDPEDARDHDDAVWVERTDDGGYLATIAIADVSSYVRDGMNSDTGAKERACSVYLPDRAVPMLPPALSSNLCSLLPHVKRLCLAVQAKLDAGGKILETRMIRGVMQSQAKLTYGGVARTLGLSENPPVDPAAEGMKEGLQTALELSRLLRTQRMKRGALDFELDAPTLPALGRPTPETTAALDSSMLDFDLGDFGTTSPGSAPEPERTTGFGGFTGGTQETVPSSLPGDADPLERKLELAEEFRQIGDLEGARDLLEEVVANAEGALRVKAQTMLEALG
jgi:ribonuclease R